MAGNPSNSLQVKEEALAGVAASVAAGCRPCLSRWVEAARNAGACERGIRLAIESGLGIRASATQGMTEFAAELQDGAPGLDAAFRAERARLVGVFACAAALAVRGRKELERAIETALVRGASPEQIAAALAIARAVSKVAGEEAERAVRRAGLDVQPTLAGSWCCEALGGESPTEEPPPCGCSGGCS